MTAEEARARRYLGHTVDQMRARLEAIAHVSAHPEAGDWPASDGLDAVGMFAKTGAEIDRAFGMLCVALAREGR